MVMKVARQIVRPIIPTPPIKTDEENPLTGLVQGKDASDIEEVYARALKAAGHQFTFDFRIRTTIKSPAPANQIDFLVYVGLTYAVEIDGEFTHKGASKRMQDEVRDIFVNEALKKKNIQPIQRVKYYDLLTQEHANSFVRRQF
jgi:hypothetical protein